MKFAILADIHANLEAFQAVLEDSREQRCTHYVFVGDFVGYGPDPKACLDLVRSLNAPCVKGEYDEWCATDMPLDGIAPKAIKSLLWARQKLTKDDRQWLKNLPYVRTIENFTVVHATLDMPERWGYVFDKEAAATSLAHQNTRLYFGLFRNVPVFFHWPK